MMSRLQVALRPGAVRVQADCSVPCYVCSAYADKSCKKATLAQEGEDRRQKSTVFLRTELHKALAGYVPIQTGQRGLSL